MAFRQQIPRINLRHLMYLGEIETLQSWQNSRVIVHCHLNLVNIELGQITG